MCASFAFQSLHAIWTKPSFANFGLSPKKSPPTLYWQKGTCRGGKVKCRNCELNLSDTWSRYKIGSAHLCKLSLTIPEQRHWWASIGKSMCTLDAIITALDTRIHAWHEQAFCSRLLLSSRDHCDWFAIIRIFEDSCDYTSVVFFSIEFHHKSPYASFISFVHCDSG